MGSDQSLAKKQVDDRACSRSTVDLLQAQWYWKSNSDRFSANEIEEWTEYSDIESKIIEAAFNGESRPKLAELDNYWINVKDSIQINKHDQNKQRQIKRILINRNQNEGVRKRRFLTPELGEPFSESGLEGGIAFIYDWKKRNKTLSDNISSFSHYDEEEVLLPPGTTFRIDKVEKTTIETYIHLFLIPEVRMVLLGRTGTELGPEIILPEISSAHQVAAPGPDVFLIVLQFDRFTPQEAAASKWITEVFDERALDYCIIVFTGLDGLKRDRITVEEFLQDAPAFLQNLIAKCEGRYIAVDNTLSADEQDETIKVLLDKISRMTENNGGQFYNNKKLLQIGSVLDRYPGWFDSLKPDGTVNLLQETEKIVGDGLVDKLRKIFR
ncbi:unnamed protein product [Didymodactylos carnosus]|uniref:WWE domain-containing protein n=2 Tax=Didymodactylos carnosus TaxID=1234261 RepID=A0A813PQC3_9BILA|nr:unnamed protein product [Didymodactylos carnosus]CAF3539173.1 unnamed protein product [Didymodactylos carnosus]